MKPIVIACALTASYFMAPYAHAGQLAEVAVIDRDSGTRLEAHYYRGEYWVAGHPGAHYAIYIRNRLDERLLAITSVDGINVLSGQTASWGQGGYVLDPGEDYQITGWRKSDYQVATFTFSPVSASYAARTGRPDNIGVIGVALFREAPSVASIPPSAPEIASDSWSRERSTDSAARAKNQAALGEAAPSVPSPSTSSPPLMQAPRAQAPTAADLGEYAREPSASAPALGTGHGERESSYVAHTTFIRRQPGPNEIIRIRYDSLAHLIAMGIVPRYRYDAAVQPNPFPDAYPSQYVPDPPARPDP